LKAERAREKAEAAEVEAAKTEALLATPATGGSGAEAKTRDEETQTANVNVFGTTAHQSSSFFRQTSGVSRGSNHPHSQPHRHISTPALHHFHVYASDSDDDDLHNKTHHSIVDGDIMHHGHRSRGNSFEVDQNESMGRKHLRIFVE